MRENEPTKLVKACGTALVVMVSIAALGNIWRGEVPHPVVGCVILLGFALFVVAKTSVVARGQWVTFGSGPMTATMGNCYRVGYWLMLVGALFTFS